VPAGLALAPVRRDLVHRVIVWQAKGSRTTLYKGKSRGDVRGGGRKPWKQKGTGRARQGSTRSPLWVGGGVAHPPQHREWADALQKRVRRAGLAAALAAKLADGRVTVVHALELDAARAGAGEGAAGEGAAGEGAGDAGKAGDAGDAGKADGAGGAAASARTRDARAMLAAHGAWGRRVLFIDGGAVPRAFAAALANVPRASALPALGANVAAVVAAERLFLTPAALRALEARCPRLTPAGAAAGAAPGPAPPTAGGA